MKTLLDDLYRIKTLRETNMLIEVRKRQYRFDECARVRDQRARELSDYRDWRPRREDELFADVSRTPVILKEIDDYKAAIGLLRERENLLVEQSDQAEKALAAAQSEWEKAKAHHAVARTAKEKFAEFLDNWRRELRSRKEYREDSELEEFSSRTLRADREGGGDENDQ
ncbi:MAG: YscO family type III secretion system apparatus protein [Gammaproteobacteria bacterium]